MNAVLYARVSTDKQADLSIPAQLEAMRAYANQKQWLVAEEFIEPGASAKTTERPALQRLLARIRDSKRKTDVVLVHKIDRLARNVYDHATIKALLTQRQVQLASVVENVDDTVPGQLVENIMASIAQFYSANLAQEVKKGMRQKVLNGGWPHLAPRGYIHVKTDGDRVSRVEPHPTEAVSIRQAFERYATGWYSLKGLATTLAREGVASSNGQPIAPAYIRRILTNPFYLGRVKWNDLEVAGAHEPLISRDLFDKVQSVLQRRFKDPRAKGAVNGFPLRGLAVCASCRGHMTAGYQKCRWGYYRCCRHGYNKALCPATKYSRADQAHRAVEKLCWKLRLSSSTIEAILRAARRLVQQQSADAQHRANSLRMKRSKLTANELRLTQLFVAGDVLPEAFKTAAVKVKADIGRTEAELARLEQNPSEVMAAVERMLGRAATIWELHEQLNDNRQVDLLRAVFETIVLDETGVVGFVLRPPFDVIFQSGFDEISGDPDRRTSPTAAETDKLAAEIIRRAKEPPVAKRDRRQAA